MANITGTGGPDNLMGTLGNDLIKGKGGADIIDGMDGDDRLKGGGGNDIIIDGGGKDKMWGGNGADTFVLVADDGERDQIRDWQSQDTIDLSAWNVHDISELSFTNLGNGQIVIAFGDEEVQVRAKGGGTLTQQDFAANDFIFAATPVYNTIDFDSLDSPVIPYGSRIENEDPGHEGFSWSTNFWFAEHDEMQADTILTGINNRTTSGDNVGISAYAQDISFSAADNFDFEQMSVGALYMEGMNLTVTGKDDGVVTGTQTIVLSTQSSSIVALDDSIFNSVDEVEFSGAGGTLHPDYANLVLGGPLTHFYIDDMIVG